MHPSVPVIMFHSIRPLNPPWHWNHLSYPPELFDSFLAYLKDKKFRTVTLAEVTAHIRGERKLSPRSIALTFDDGYLDNWTVVVPLLRRYGFCGTVFVNPEFVDQREVVRRQIESPEEKPDRSMLNGFMSWPELKAADSSGILDVQSHGMTHTWYFISDKIVDFHHPGDDYPWLAWNARPERKYLWLEEDQSEFVGFGSPVFEHERAMIARRCIPPEGFDETLIRYVGENGGRVFFQDPNWRLRLRKKAETIKGRFRYETKNEHTKRIEWELSASREEIGSRLGKTVDFLCWPGGGHDADSTKTALRCGYQAWTVNGVHNRFNTERHRIHRMSFPLLKSPLPGNWINRLVYRYKVESSCGMGLWALTRLFVPRLYALWSKTRRGTNHT